MISTVQLKKALPQIQCNVPLADMTAFKIGGKARWFYEARSGEMLQTALAVLKKQKVPYVIIGAGKNVLCSSAGIKKCVVVFRGGTCTIHNGQIKCDAGALLSDVVRLAVAQGIGGFEKMAGIPGTIGGAVRGNAGSFGQVIGDRVLSVDTWDGKKKKTISQKGCKFQYRSSIFKKNSWPIFSVVFGGPKADKEMLKKESADTVALRKSKFDTTLAAPGSYFKNIEIKKISKKALRLIDPTKIREGKVPAGYVLDEVGARKMNVGDARVADFHGNWIYNAGKAHSNDVRKLAETLKRLVRKRFGIELEEEVQYIV